MQLIDILGFWGKARPRSDSVVRCHPVAYHLLDVAAVADALLDARPLARARAGRLLGLSADDAHRLLVALTALHDLGKFAPAFQGKEPAHWPSVLGPFEASRVTGTRHTDDGYVFWRSALAPRISERLWPGGGHALEALAPGVFGHHGRPIARTKLVEQRAEWSFGAAALRAAMGCADAVVDLLLPEPMQAPPPTVTRMQLASWWVAGLVTIADWIGSREKWFPYTAPHRVDAGAIARYWSYARDRAREAVHAEGLAAPTGSPLRSFASLTLGRILEPSPAQAWAETVVLPDGPVLVLLEDVTGAGKTEAAQMLVHRLMAAGRTSGAYWAMPTQATANAMYGRQAGAIDALFEASDRRPSLVLAHGQTRLHDGFRASVLSTEPSGGPPHIAETGDEEMPSRAACAAFFADDRRAAFLADVGAGTVDQALLGVLPSKFNAVRLFGLADKVLVVDEAHAYDAYTGVEVRELLRFHAALGGSAVVLSATLSRKQREALAAAWLEGLDGGRRRVARAFTPEPPPLVQETAYPLATVVSKQEGVRETRVAAAPWSCREVGVCFVHDAQVALDHVVETAARGAAVAWVRNTVDDCIASAAALAAKGLHPIVFHARFTQGDRQRREADVLRLFGKGAPAEDRRGRVLVATQVIEQSLDLDFDVLVSDLAPIDLLVQRAGRLWRHPERNGHRPPGLHRELVVLAPPDDCAPARDWITALLPGTARVYQDAGVLWRTVRALTAARTIKTPDGLRDLIEAVYGSDEVPEALERASDAAQAKDSAARSVANDVVLKVGEGYHGDSAGWIDELRAMTRLSDSPTTTVRLARIDHDGTLVPWERDEPVLWKAWALSEVRPRASRVAPGATAEPQYRLAVERVRAEWGRFEQELPVLPLREAEAGVWRGTLLDPERGRSISLRYTAREGLAYEARPA